MKKKKKPRNLPIYDIPTKNVVHKKTSFFCPECELHFSFILLLLINDKFELLLFLYLVLLRHVIVFLTKI